MYKIINILLTKVIYAMRHVQLCASISIFVLSEKNEQQKNTHTHNLFIHSTANNVHFAYKYYQFICANDCKLLGRAHTAMWRKYNGEWKKQQQQLIFLVVSIHSSAFRTEFFAQTTCTVHSRTYKSVSQRANKTHKLKSTTIAICANNYWGHKQFSVLIMHTESAILN